MSENYIAYKQAEKIRDIRHDFRNQIQTVQYLLRSGEDKVGREMFNSLKKRVSDLE